MVAASGDKGGVIESGGEGEEMQIINPDEACSQILPHSSMGVQADVPVQVKLAAIVFQD